MQAHIVSDHPSMTAQVREVLLRAGLDCPAGSIHPTADGANRLTHERPDLVVVIVTPDPDAGLASLSQIHLMVNCPIIAIGKTADGKVLLKAMRSGADDFVDEGELESDLAAAIHRQSAQLVAQVEPARTIALLGPSGGSGSSTLAANVATALATKHQSSLLIDLKLHSGDLAALLDLKPTHTLADLCQNAAKMDRTMFERSLVRHASGVHLLAPPRTFADIRHVTVDGVRQALSLGRALFPYVVADLDHSFAPEQIQFLRQADVILLVLRLDFACLRNAQRAMDHLEQTGVSRERIQVIANRYGQAKEVPASKAEEALRVRILHYVPEDPKTVNRANNSGVPVVLESPSAKVAKSIINLAVSVNGRHTK